MTGEVICEAGTKLTDELCDKIQNAGAPSVTVRIDEIEEGKTTKVLSNLAVDIDGYIEQFGLTKEDLGIEEKVYLPVLMNILEANDDADSFKAAVKANMHELVPKCILLWKILWLLLTTVSTLTTVSVQEMILTTLAIEESEPLANFYRTSSELVCQEWKEL